MVLSAQALAAAMAVERGEFLGADAPILAICESVRSSRGDDHDMSQRVLRRVVRLYERTGRPDDAARYAALLKK